MGYGAVPLALLTVLTELVMLSAATRPRRVSTCVRACPQTGKGMAYIVMAYTVMAYVPTDG